MEKKIKWKTPITNVTDQNIKKKLEPYMNELIRTIKNEDYTDFMIITEVRLFIGKEAEIHIRVEKE